MRKFHNRIKLQIITQSVLERKRHYPHQEISVLDVSVGRFGDLHNYVRAGVNYVLGMDPHEESINEAERRLIKTDLNAELFIATITDDEKPTPLDNKLFSIACCHFTMHYFFETERMLRNALKHISNSLLLGGYFIGTTINGKCIHECDKTDNHYFIKKLYNSDSTPPFGMSYKFKLLDNPEAGIYFDINEEKPEYLVDIPTLKKCAFDYGLKLLKCTDFWQYPYNGKKFFQPWEKTISQMNVSFVFVKIKMYNTNK